MKKIAFASIVVAAALAPAAQVHGAGWVQVLKDTPAEHFDDEDIKMFVDAAKAALEAEGEPKPTSWSNPATGSGGTFTEVKKTTAKDGSPCKRVRFSVYARKRSEKFATWTACKDGSGRWRVVSAS